LRPAFSTWLLLLAGVAPAAAALESIPVAVETVRRETAFDGVLEAVNRSTVAAQTSARVEDIAFDVGDYVEKGAVIIRFRDTEQQARLASAEAGLREAEARLADAEANHDRVRGVHERGLLPKAELDRAIADLESARARLEAARAAVKEAGEGVEHTVIRAPYAGIVVERHIKPGETATVGRPLMTGLSLEHLRAVVDVPQQSIEALRQHGKARIVLPDGASVEAARIRFPPDADPATHTFRVLVDLPEGRHGVFPGMLVKVAFTSGTSEALLVPASALARRSEVTAVYVIGETGRVGFRYVRTGTPAADGRVPILSGLAAGERIALDPVAAGAEYKVQAAAGP
jgi:RND family efflux transporter MFP subunit